MVFLAGVLVGAATLVLWKALRFAADLRAARHAVSSYVFPDCGVADELAQKAVENCKNRLRWQKSLNPEWLPPLVDEVPKLVREIAAIYHPGKQEALLAPGLSQFSRAVHLAAMDVADFLQTRSIGRLVDVSASTAIKTWEMTHKIATHEKMQTANNPLLRREGVVVLNESLRNTSGARIAFLEYFGEEAAFVTEAFGLQQQDF